MTFAESVSSFLGPSESHIPDDIAHSQQEIAPSTWFLTLEAKHTTKQTFTGSYENPNIFTSFTPSSSPISDQLSFLAFQCSEFALPIRADSSLKFNFFSRPGFVRPHTVFPLLIFTPSNECLLLAPIDFFHEQVIAIKDNKILCGWSGDLEEVHAGFKTTLAVLRRDSPRAALDDWGGMVRSGAREAGVVNRRGRYADVSVAKLSYWTDNGAAYWYRREPDMDLPTTLERTIRKLDDAQVPVAAVELDSWFYTHQVTRKVTAVGYLDQVPPTGMISWEPRSDVLPDGILSLRKRLGNRPLILHSRHMSAENQYIRADAGNVERLWWTDNDRAHPVHDHWFRTWMQQASDWGADTYEQDWLVEVWLGVRALRAKPGRISRWQKQLDNAAAERSISLIWCMATPADMATAVSLEQIVAVRSCDDYRYADDPSTLWRWHLTTSALLRSLGLWPYKDVFMSHGNETGEVDIDGDPNAMLEACLAALSAGPFGIGDRLGRTAKEVVMKACRSDGVIIKPDFPMAALDRSLINPKGLLWGETGCGPWRYVIAIRTGKKSGEQGPDDRPLEESLSLDTSEDVLVYNWRTEETWLASERKNVLTVALSIHEWALWVLCPLRKSALANEATEDTFTVIGDKNTFATVGDRRFRFDNSTIQPQETLRGMPAKRAGLSSTRSGGGDPESLLNSLPTSPQNQDACFEFDICGVHGETIDVSYWSQRRGLCTEKVTIPGKSWNHAQLRFDADVDGVVLVHE